MSTPLSRRRFLALAAAGFVASCSSGGSDSASDTTSSVPDVSKAPTAELSGEAGPGLRGLFDDARAVAAVGVAAASTPSSPTREDSEALLLSLGATRAESGEIDVDDAAGFAAAVREQVRADHRDGDVHVVEGWVLARTQAALAVVMAG